MPFLYLNSLPVLARTPSTKMNESDEHELFDDEVEDEEEEQKHVLHHNEMNEAQ